MSTFFAQCGHVITIVPGGPLIPCGGSSMGDKKRDPQPLHLK